MTTASHRFTRADYRPLAIRPEDREVETPVLVVEVLSEATAGYDRHVKARRYLAFGVREVWLVDPVARTVEVRRRAGTEIFGPGGAASSGVVPGFALDLPGLFGT